ncbi:MAG: hypothetical protein Q4E69_04795 [Bacilli bacterium]|nr:hypothetical protein [Bacilli bacterium]
MINYCNEEVRFDGCPGCAYAKHEFELPCGMIFENNNFTLSQDWELPIVGFLVVAPKRHIEKLAELSKQERDEMFDIVNKTIIKLRENNICDRFDIIFEEKENRHFHVWIMPRYNWMKEINEDIIDNIGKIFEYAKTNFRNKETYDKIADISSLMREEMNK